MLFAPLLLIAYLIGSIPWAVWIGQWFYLTDVRLQGSRSAGATNTFRVLGKTAGSVVLVLDVLKGAAAATLGLLVRQLAGDHQTLVLLQLCLGIAATAGHVYPVFAGFRGGKGVATLSGVMLLLFPKATLFALLVFLTVFLISRFVSLSSMIASVTLPWMVCLLYGFDYAPLQWTLWLVPVIIIFTHRANIERLAQGKENKMKVFR